MSYYFKLLSNIPGYGTSWSYSAQLKSTLQDEAKEAEKKKKKEMLDFTCSISVINSFLKYISTNDLRLKGSALGFATSFVNLRNSLKPLF